MVTERMRRNLERLLDEAESAMSARDWSAVAERARAALAIEAANEDALTFLRMVEANSAGSKGAGAEAAEPVAAAEPLPPAEEASSSSPSGFVGRARELGRLRAAFDSAVSGQGALVMLVGEPGIGKTRTTQELCEYARQRGGVVAWGRAHESPGAPAYWPWVQAGRDYVAQVDDPLLTRQLRDYAVQLQRMFPGLRDRFPALPEPPPVDSAEGQFVLFDAVSSFFRAASADAPVVIVLDDLHWADRSTLQLLTHVAREIAQARLLVIGTYRDTDLDRTHPLTEALGELNRESLFVRIPLRGLSAAETAAYVHHTAGSEVSPALLARITEETEGNPFFLAQTMALLSEKETVAAAGGFSIPEGIKEALGRRLQRLSSEANELLAVAAVAGREFTHALLAAVTGWNEDLLIERVEESLAAHVLEETGRAGEYRFVHALMQEMLLDELSAARQVRLHGQIAEALERLASTSSSTEAVTQLAAHFAESAVLNPRHARSAARYLHLAAEEAAAALAYAEAAAHYERCLELVGEAPDRIGEDEPALWIELAVCRLLIGDPAGSWDACVRGLSAAASASPGDRIRLLNRVVSHAIAPYIRPRAGFLMQQLDQLGEEATPEACALLAVLAFADPGTKGDALAARATTMAQVLGLEADRLPWPLTVRPLYAAIQRGDFARAVADAEAVDRSALALWPGESAVLVAVALATMLAGDMGRLVPAWNQLLERARQVGERRLEVWSVGLDRLQSMRDGMLQPVQTPYRRAAAPYVVEMEEMVAARNALERGELEQALRIATGAEGVLPDGVQSRRGLIAGALAALGRSAEARADLEAFLAWFDEDSPLTANCAVLAAWGDALCALDDHRALERVASYLARYPAMRYWTPLGTGPDHMRGAIALRLGLIDDAEQHFRIGLEWASRSDVRFVIDQGRCHQGLAEVAERRGEFQAARSHLDAAGELFSKQGAKLYLDQVMAKKSVLSA